MTQTSKFVVFILLFTGAGCDSIDEQAKKDYGLEKTEDDINNQNGDPLEKTENDSNHQTGMHEDDDKRQQAEDPDEQMRAKLNSELCKSVPEPDSKSTNFTSNAKLDPKILHALNNFSTHDSNWYQNHDPQFGPAFSTNVGTGSASYNFTFNWTPTTKLKSLNTNTTYTTDPNYSFFQFSLSGTDGYLAPSGEIVKVHFKKLPDGNDRKYVLSFSAVWEETEGGEGKSSGVFSVDAPRHCIKGEIHGESTNAPEDI